MVMRTKLLISNKLHEDLAEREGFEPPEPFRVQWFSRPPPSTTRPSLRIEIAPEPRRVERAPRTNAPCHRKCNPRDDRDEQSRRTSSPFAATRRRIGLCGPGAPAGA